MTREEQILHYRPLALKMARKRFPGNEDAESQAVLGVINAVDKIIDRNLPDINHAGYVAKSILNFLYRKGLENVPETFDNERESYDEEVVMVKDLIEYIIKSPLQRSIIEMRMVGYDDMEIAEAFGCSRSKVFKERLKLQERLSHVYRELGTAVQ